MFPMLNVARRVASHQPTYSSINCSVRPRVTLQVLICQASVGASFDWFGRALGSSGNRRRNGGEMMVRARVEDSNKVVSVLGGLPRFVKLQVRRVVGW